MEPTNRLLEDTLKEAVRAIDARFESIEEIAEGTFSKVFKVALSGGVYALKVDRAALGISELQHHLDRKKIKRPDCRYEVYVQSKLTGIMGVPEIRRVYNEYAFLMEYVNGASLRVTGEQDSLFFDKLVSLKEEINMRGYSLPKDVFYGNNILVDTSCNPWVVDFMLSERLTKRNKRNAMDNFIVNHLRRQYSR